MSGSIVSRTYLEYRGGTSDKFYRIVIAEIGDQFMTTAWWGRRGSTGQTQTKSFGSRAEAENIYDRFIWEKLRKGYRVATDPLQ
jgi:predicted DNA-binding WGR domain protein